MYALGPDTEYITFGISGEGQIVLEYRNTDRTVVQVSQQQRQMAISTLFGSTNSASGVGICFRWKG